MKHKLSITVDEDLNDAIRHLEENPVSFTVLSDQNGAAATKFDLPSLPVAYLMDSNKKIIGVFPGLKQQDFTKIRALIK